jgi:hypothetical protein
MVIYPTLPPPFSLLAKALRPINVLKYHPLLADTRYWKGVTFRPGRSTRMACHLLPQRRCNKEDSRQCEADGRWQPHGCSCRCRSLRPLMPPPNSPCGQRAPHHDACYDATLQQRC